MTQKVDIVDKLGRLIEVGSQPGCNIWLSMVVSTLAHARREIVRLRAQVEANRETLWGGR